MIAICALTSARFTVCQQRVPVLTQTPSPRGFNDAYLATSKCITIWKGDTHYSMSYIGIKLHFRIICDPVILHISFILDWVGLYVVNVTVEFVCFNKWLLKVLCTIRWLHIICFPCILMNMATSIYSIFACILQQRYFNNWLI